MDPQGGKWPTQEEAKTYFNNIRIQTKLNHRKQMIQEAIQKRSFKSENPIAGYNLSAYRKKRKKSNIRCWTCGNRGHTSISCRSMKISQIQRLIWELQKRIEILEIAAEESNIKAAKLQRKHIAKIKKKKKKKHKEKVDGMNRAVTMKILLNKDEDIGLQYGTPKYLTEAMALHQSLKPREKIQVEKEYFKLFGESLKEKILDAIDIDDAVEEYLDSDT